MAWTAPNTAVAGTVWTSADFNLYVRDNLLETGPGITGGPPSNGYFVTTGSNSIAFRSADEDLITTSETTTSSVYVDLATVGPTVTIDTGEYAMVFLNVDMPNSSGATPNYHIMSFAISGATTVAASDTFSIARSTGSPTASEQTYAGAFLVTGLNAGSNTFTAKYRRNVASTARFAERRLAVMPL